MKTLLVVALAVSVILSITTFAQQASPQTAQESQPASATSLNTIDGTVQAQGDKITFRADKDQKTWDVQNPEVLKGHEGHHVQLQAHVYPDKGSIHVMDVKMLEKTEKK